MIRHLTVNFVILLSSFVTASAQEGEVVHSLFFVGDAGEPYVSADPISRILRARISAAGENTTVVFLGDNVYPRGLPEADSREYPEAASALQTQTDFVKDLPARGYFIPGNHDWQHWGRKGLQYLENQQQWIDSLKNDHIILLPRNGCPGPVEIPLNANTLLVILDTQWFLHQWDKPKDEALCGPINTAEVLTMVHDIFLSNPGKRIILAGHHPLITYGEHGGVFTWKHHLFPLADLNKHLYIPLPVIGSIYPLYRKWFGHIQDTSHPLYREFSTALQDIITQYPGTIYVAGHEHTLQYIVKDSVNFIVSGSGAKTEHVRKKKYAVFADAVRGFVQGSVYRDGSISLHYIRVDEQYPEGKEIFTRILPGIKEFQFPAEESLDFTGQVVRVHASDQYRAGKGKQKLLGKNYRAEWATDTNVPVFDIGHEKGGLKILQKGGGQQTLSLRLADSAGHEYVLRSVEKYPEAATPEMLRKTFAQDLIQDQISAAHPYAALVIPPLAEAAGIYHTNPRLVYIPDDPRLHAYRKTFANSLALFEERPDEDWSEADFFGNSENIIGTTKLLEKLADDNDNQVDEKFVLRNRLFDLVIGDWDRHDDQWRWATIKDKKDDIFRPIPRDRDQTFFVNEGIIPKIWSRRWALPKFEGFDNDIDWPSGLSFNARYFDRSFLTGLSRKDWLSIAGDLQKDLTDEAIEKAIHQWPKEIFALHGNRIIEALKSRRDNLVEHALAHYEFLAREVDVTGSDKREQFNVGRLQNGDVHVVVNKITKKGEVGKKLYDRNFKIQETKEIRLFGLKDDDVFNFSGTAGKSILVRVIGGDGADELADSSRAGGLSKKTIFYDQAGQATLYSSGEVRNLISTDPLANEYNRKSFEYNRLAPLLYGDFNFDDGIFLGGGFLYLTQGFRKEPFKQRHLFLATIAPLTQSFNFRYQGKFTDVAGKWDLELEGDLKSPNYVNNFFGMGNESVFNRDIDDEPGITGVDEAIHYYRYRFEEVLVQASLSRPVGNWGNVKIGPVFQRIEMEEPEPGEDRFIQEYANTLPVKLFNEYNSFGGVAWEFDITRRDNNLFTRRGSVLSLAGRNMAGLNKAQNNFSSYEGSLAFFHSFRQQSRLVFAVRAGGGINTGDYAFYQAQILGGKEQLRGYRKTRFYGDSKFYANFEVRLRLTSFRSYLFPASMGILGFHDLGRIWYKNENGADPSVPDGESDLWHKGWGGGVWFTPFNLTILSAEVGHSSEGTMGYVRLGFLF